MQGEKARLNEDSGKKSGGRTDRTTRMLVALLGLFLATELPQALFGLLTAIAPHLFQVCYYAFGKYSIMLYTSENGCKESYIYLWYE